MLCCRSRMGLFEPFAFLEYHFQPPNWIVEAWEKNLRDEIWVSFLRARNYSKTVSKCLRLTGRSYHDRGWVWLFSKIQPRDLSGLPKNLLILREQPFTHTQPLNEDIFLGIQLKKASLSVFIGGRRKRAGVNPPATPPEVMDKSTVFPLFQFREEQSFSAAGRAQDLVGTWDSSGERNGEGLKPPLPRAPNPGRQGRREEGWLTESISG